MQPFFLLFFPVIAVAGFLIASYFDFKFREIPPQLSYGLIAIGLIGHAAFSVLMEDALFIIQSAVLCILCFFFAFSLYRFGVWAGGDVKMFAALGALLPAFGSLPVFPFLALGFTLIMVLPFSMLYAAHFFVRNKDPREKVARKFRLWMKRAFYTPFYLLSAFFICLLAGIHWIVMLPISAVFVRARLYAIPVVAFFSAWAFLDNHIFFLEYFVYLFIVSAILFLGITSFKALQEHALRETVQVKHLKEGMVIDPKKARGLTKKEINALKKSNIKEVTVRKTLPFTPILTLGLTVLILIGALFYA